MSINAITISGSGLDLVSMKRHSHKREREPRAFNWLTYKRVAIHSRMKVIAQQITDEHEANTVIHVFLVPSAVPLPPPAAPSVPRAVPLLPPPANAIDIITYKYGETKSESKVKVG